MKKKHDFLMNSKEQQIFETEMFIFTFDQNNVSWLVKSISFFQKSISDPKRLNMHILYILKPNFNVWFFKEPAGCSTVLARKIDNHRKRGTMGTWAIEVNKGWAGRRNGNRAMERVKNEKNTARWSWMERIKHMGTVISYTSKLLQQRWKYNC